MRQRGLLVQFLPYFYTIVQKMRLEEMPLRRNSDEQDFELDEETDYLLQPTQDTIRLMISRNRRYNNGTKILKKLLCG